MKTFFAFVKKEIYHILRDYRTLLILIGMPLAQLILFGFAIRTEINDAKIAIYDPARDEASRMLKNKIISSGYFTLTRELSSLAEAEQSLRSGESRQVIAFEPGFGDRLQKEGRASIAVINDASSPNAASMINSYTRNIILDFAKDLKGMGNSANPVINADIRMIYNPEMKSVVGFVPGLIALLLMLISALMTSIAITREKEKGTMEVLLVSPLNPLVIIFGKVVPYVLLSIFNAALIVILGITIFHVPFAGSFLIFGAEVLLYVITALTLGILISTIADTQQTALMISLAGLLLPTVLLSGFIFPVENMPVILRAISFFIPARWFLVIIKNIMLKGNGIEYFWKETLVLVAYSVLFLTIAIRKFKIRLE